MTETSTKAPKITKADAEIAKLVAETNASLRQADLAELDKELKQIQIEKERANTRKELANASEAEHDAAIRAIRRAEIERGEALALIQDHYVQEHFFDGPVNTKTVYACLNTLAAWHRVDPTSDMNITINSPGGSVIDGMHLFDQLTTYSLRGGGTHKVTITVRGYAASMAGILLQAADERVIGRESYLMIHEISAGTGGKIGEIKDDVKWYTRLCERVVDIFVERAAEAADAAAGVEGIDKETFETKWERQDWWLDSAESLKLGFVDRVG